MTTNMTFSTSDDLKRFLMNAADNHRDMYDIEQIETMAEPIIAKIGLDIDIRKHNREAIEAHPMSSRIQMIQGSSIALEVIEQVKAVAKNYQRVLVCLDSNHTHDHVLAELEAYAPIDQCC
jgi:cephalosporin hydroxylase